MSVDICWDTLLSEHYFTTCIQMGQSPTYLIKLKLVERWNHGMFTIGVSCGGDFIVPGKYLGLSQQL